MDRDDLKRWRGSKALVHDAVDAVTDLVDLGHESTMRTVTAVTDRTPAREPVRFVDGVRRLTTRGVLGTIRGVNRVVEVVTDAALDAAEGAFDAPPAAIPAVPMRSDAVGSGAWVADAALGLVNAAVGDHLERRRNGLDLEMVFRVGDAYVPLTGEAVERAAPEASSKVALFVHGLGTTEWSWCLEGEAYHGDPSASFGSLLARDLGFSPVFVRYNSGRRVSRNGRRLAALLERFVDAWPVPIEDLTLIGHSMGGLVLRSACHYARADGLRWPAEVTRLFCLGTPHRGAPLAKLGHVLAETLERVDLPATRITGRILARRSEGIQDLRHGAVLDEEWRGPAPDGFSAAELLPHAEHYFVGASITEDPGHAVGRLVGDLLVRCPSADGPRLREDHFPIETRRYGGVMHHQIQNHPAVYAQIRAACAPASRP